MDFPFESKQPGPLPWLVLLVCAIYLLAGIVGHDPWKADDAIGLAVAHDFYTGSDWLKPTLAGEAWVDASPLWYWLSALTAKIAGLVLAFHDAARLATALIGGLFLFLLAGSARKLYGEDAAWGAPLLAIGTLGLLLPLHEAQPAAAILAATSGVYFGLAMLAERPLAGAITAGGSLGACFLAGGLGGVLPPLTLLILPVLQRRYLAAAVSLGLGGIVAAIWPLLLAKYDPAFLDAWWSHQLALVDFREGLSGGHAKFLGWFAWPVLYVAPWAIWRNRHQLTAPGVLLPLLGTIVALVWFVAHKAETESVLPLIPPLVLLAAAGNPKLRRGAANAWDWFGMMTLTFAALLVWLGYVTQLTGWPPKISANAARLVPGFSAEFSFLAVGVALAATGAWIMTLVRLPRSPWRVTTRWAVGVTVAWTLLMALWLPMIDYGKTYRPVIRSLRQALPAEHGCIGRLSLGAPQRAALLYFGDIRTRWGNKACDWLIVQGDVEETRQDGWQKIWEGHRPGDRTERLRLYKRSGT